MTEPELSATKQAMRAFIKGAAQGLGVPGVIAPAFQFADEELDRLQRERDAAVDALKLIAWGSSKGNPERRIAQEALAQIEPGKKGE